MATTFNWRNWFPKIGEQLMQQSSKVAAVFIEAAENISKNIPKYNGQFTAESPSNHKTYADGTVKQSLELNKE